MAAMVMPRKTSSETSRAGRAVRVAAGAADAGAAIVWTVAMTRFLRWPG
jgi:hypothetical protein